MLSGAGRARWSQALPCPPVPSWLPRWQSWSQRRVWGSQVGLGPGQPALGRGPADRSCPAGPPRSRGIGTSRSAANSALLVGRTEHSHPGSKDTRSPEVLEGAGEGWAPDQLATDVTLILGGEGVPGSPSWTKPESAGGGGLTAGGAATPAHWCPFCFAGGLPSPEREIFSVNMNLACKHPVPRCQPQSRSEMPLQPSPRPVTAAGGSENGSLLIKFNF